MAALLGLRCSCGTNGRHTTPSGSKPITLRIATQTMRATSNDRETHERRLAQAGLVALAVRHGSSRRAQRQPVADRAAFLSGRVDREERLALYPQQRGQ